MKSRNHVGHSHVKRIMPCVSAKLWAAAQHVPRCLFENAAIRACSTHSRFVLLRECTSRSMQPNFTAMRSNFGHPRKRLCAAAVCRGPRRPRESAARGGGGQGRAGRADRGRAQQGARARPGGDSRGVRCCAAGTQAVDAVSGGAAWAQGQRQRSGGFLWQIHFFLSCQDGVCTDLESELLMKRGGRKYAVLFKPSSVDRVAFMRAHSLAVSHSRVKLC